MFFMLNFTYVHNIYEFGIQSCEGKKYIKLTNYTMVAQLQYQLPTTLLVFV